MTHEELSKFERLYQGRYVYLTGEPAGDGTIVATERFASEDGAQSFSRTGLGMDCSHFVERYLIHDGYDIPYLDTKSVFSGADEMERGASRYLEHISDEEVTVGDLVYFSGHVGIVSEWNSGAGIGKILHMGFEGGVTRVPFNRKTGFYGGKKLLGFARPRDAAHNVGETSKRLREYQRRESEAIEEAEAFEKPVVKKDIEQIRRLASKPAMTLSALDLDDVRVGAFPSMRRPGLRARVGTWFSKVFGFWSKSKEKAWVPSISGNRATSPPARRPAPSPLPAPALRPPAGGNKPAKPIGPDSTLWSDAAAKKRKEEEAKKLREDEIRKEQRDADEHARREKERKKIEDQQKAAKTRKEKLDRDEEERRRRLKEADAKRRAEEEADRERRRKEDEKIKKGEELVAKLKKEAEEKARRAQTDGIQRRMGGGVGGGYSGEGRGGPPIDTFVVKYDRTTGEYLGTFRNGERID